MIETTAAVIRETLTKYLPKEATAVVTTRTHHNIHTLRTEEQVLADIYCPPEQRKRVVDLIEEIFDAEQTSDGVWSWRSNRETLLFCPRHDMERLNND